MCDLFADDVYDAINLDTCVNGRDVEGGPAPARVAAQIEAMQKKLASYDAE